MIKIVIDAMGGDFAPAQQVKGAVEALQKTRSCPWFSRGTKAR
ncbi:MAG: hypothetical protein ACLS4Z_02125 [Christensenellaceae bacterium]